MVLISNFQQSVDSFYRGQFFDLVIEYGTRKTYIAMRMHGDVFVTRHLPQTSAILKSELPGVLLTKCFNDKKLKFAQEVKNTEIGHMFEHIMLENLCNLKQKNGFREVKHRGETWWDWDNDPRGFFHIEVDSGWGDRAFFKEALDLSIKLTENVMRSREEIYLPNGRPA